MKNINLHILFACMKKLSEPLICLNQRLTMIKTKKISVIISIVLIIGSDISCRKADRDTDTATQMASDNSLAIFLYNDMFRQVHRFALSDTTLNSVYTSNLIDTSCIDTVTHTNNPGFFPDTIIVDFGMNNGTACSDGIFRRGKLQMIFTGKYNATLKSVTVNPIAYYVSDYKTEGKMSISCRGKNSSSNYYFSLNITGGKISNDSIYQEFSSSFQREWNSGESTLDFNDDIFMLTGKSNGVTSKGTIYSSEITTALQSKYNCKWISGGVEKIIPQNLSPRIVTYSGCSSSAKVGINGKDYDVMLLP